MKRFLVVLVILLLAAAGAFAFTFNQFQDAFQGRPLGASISSLSSSFQKR